MTKEKCKPLTNYTYPNLVWRNNRIPIAQKFDDPYYSLDNGLEEVRHVFLNSNKLAQRLKDGFKIAELGFGTGLNFLSTLWQWRLKKQKGKLSFTSFETFPMKPEDMVKAQNEFVELSSIKHEFSSLWIELLEKGVLYGRDYKLQLILGDACRTIKNVDIKANCWFLDGFS
ncbi:MAG: tRNA (5-methylaminomethyl-2-thiouridine)(34)-methyltransferase MnmD, partial [Rhodobacterales bacterium]|nr:tRNA (5-methylaminomethyl-2-thiouridine)(34)-methyltransferase MnmD [Rhodobacterales bacterium]